MVEIMKDDVVIDGGDVLIYSKQNWGPYEISFDRLKTYEDCTKWLAQLCDKTWFTPELASKFIAAFSSVTGLSVRGL